MSEENKNTKTVQKASKAAAKETKMVEVEALKTPVITEKATLAKGGRVTMEQSTAELKAKAGEVTIVRVIS